VKLQTSPSGFIQTLHLTGAKYIVDGETVSFGEFIKILTLPGEK
jgi:hypothetical protein